MGEHIELGKVGVGSEEGQRVVGHAFPPYFMILSPPMLIPLNPLSKQLVK